MLKFLYSIVLFTVIIFVGWNILVPDQPINLAMAGLTSLGLMIFQLVGKRFFFYKDDK